MPNDQAELEALLMSRSLTDEELLRATETAPDYRRGHWFETSIAHNVYPLRMAQPVESHRALIRRWT